MSVGLSSGAESSLTGQLASPCIRTERGHGRIQRLVRIEPTSLAMSRPIEGCRRSLLLRSLGLRRSVRDGAETGGQKVEEAVERDHRHGFQDLLVPEAVAPEDLNVLV